MDEFSNVSALTYGKNKTVRDDSLLWLRTVFDFIICIVGVFRSLRRAPKDAVFRICELFVEKQVGKQVFNYQKLLFPFGAYRTRESRRRTTCARTKLLSSQLTDYANSVQAQPAERRVLKLQFRRKPKRDTVSSFKLVSQLVSLKVQKVMTTPKRGGMTSGL